MAPALASGYEWLRVDALSGGPLCEITCGSRPAGDGYVSGAEDLYVYISITAKPDIYTDKSNVA